MITIEPVKCEDGIERLPYPEEVGLGIGNLYLVEDCTPAQYRNWLVYMAIQEKYNYYQDNTPTPFGDPAYSHHCGFLAGVAAAYQLNISEFFDSDWIYVYNQNDYEIMKVKKPKDRNNVNNIDTKIDKTLEWLKGLK